MKDMNSNVPVTIMEHYQNVTLAADIMTVNQHICFFMSVSRNIQFGTGEHITNMAVPTLVKSVKQIQQLYMQRGFRITEVLMDGQFEPTRGDLAVMGILLNTVLADEHVPEVERYIRTIKERVRSVYNSLPFKRVPVLMITEMVALSVLWLNSFPQKGGVSKTMSLRGIVVGSNMDYLKHCCLEFGKYVQTHKEHDNSMATQTIGALALQPMGNAQGGHYFISLTTGR